MDGSFCLDPAKPDHHTPPRCRICGNTSDARCTADPSLCRPCAWVLGELRALRSPADPAPALHVHAAMAERPAILAPDVAELAELDPLRIAGAIPGAAVWMNAAGQVEIGLHPEPAHPITCGVELRPDVVDAWTIAAIACQQHGITFEELIQRARAALERWPLVQQAMQEGRAS